MCRGDLMNILNRIVFIFIFVAGALYAQDCSYIKKIRSFDALTEKDRFCMVQTLAAKINAVLPSQVDDNTVLSSLTPQGDRLLYHYDLDGSSTQSKETLKKNTAKENCENHMLRNLLNIGVTLEYEYKSGNTLWTRFAIDKKICKQI